jgi:general secretion pathway protein F
MAAYEYVALDADGRQLKGVLEADSDRHARQLLREKSWVPLSVEAALQKVNSHSPRKSNHTTLSTYDLALVTRQLATLIQAALPIDEALKAVSQQSNKPKISSMMLAIRSKVMEGYTLSQSLNEYEHVFNSMFRATVAAGEHSGHLDLVLNQLADYTESRQQSDQKIKLALLYPLILTIVALLIVSGLMGFVVPNIVKVFTDTGQALPLLTRWLIATSHFVKFYGVWVVLLFAAIGFAVRYALKQPELRLKWDRQLLHIPLIRYLVGGSNISRFASTLSILGSSGVPLVEALSIAGRVLSNTWLKQKVEEATQRVSEGSSLKNALEKSGYFPPLMLHMIASGESSGELDQMLKRVAQNQERDLDSFVTALVRLFEPIMLVVMGIVVFIIVMAILLPIFNMNDLVT